MSKSIKPVAALVASSGEEKQTKSNLGVGDCAVGSKFLPQFLIVDGVVKVPDVEIDALVSVQPLQLQMFKLLLQLLLTFSPSTAFSTFSSSTAFSADSLYSKETKSKPLFFPSDPASSVSV